jgi:hypothetical protein
VIRALRAARGLARFGVHLWLWATLVLPAVHALEHAGLGAGHDHGPAGHAPAAPDPRHGHGALEHMGVAFHAAPVFVLVREAEDADIIPTAPPPRAPALPLPHQPRQPRGPPDAPVV